MDIVWAGALSFLLSATFVRLLASQPLAKVILDIPNHRSLHVRPVPRSGGIGLLIAAGIAWIAFAPGALSDAIAGAACLAAASLFDDISPLPVGVRLLIQATAAVALLAAIDMMATLALPLLIAGIMWMTNLYNFMDGADGLAGGMTVIGFAGYALAGALGEQHDIALVAVIVSAAALGFLVWNFHPARIFLGDCGSIPLGFLAAAIGLIGWMQGAWSWWFPPLLFAPFIVDATLTLLRRAARGENLFAAHRQHFYQRIIRNGYGQRETALAAYGLMLFCLLAALLLRELSGPIVPCLLVVLAGVFLTGSLLIERFLSRSETIAHEK